MTQKLTCLGHNLVVSPQTKSKMAKEDASRVAGAVILVVEGQGEGWRQNISSENEVNNHDMKNI